MAMEKIKETEQDHCVDIAVTRDCSYFLTEKLDKMYYEIERSTFIYLEDVYGVVV